MKRRQWDQISVFILIAFTLLLYFVLIPTQIPADRMGLSSSFFPKLIVIVIAGLSVILFFKAVFSKNPEGEEVIFRMAKGSAIRLVAIFGLMVGYIFFLYLLGFLVSTPLFLAILIYYSGQRNWRIILPLIILVTAGLYAFFTFGMKLILPQSILF
jgi:putative tricarboxylic transport membrane protein